MGPIDNLLITTELKPGCLPVFQGVTESEIVATWEPKLIDAKRKLKEIDHDRTRVRRADRQVVDGGANRGCDSSVRARGDGNVRASEAVGMADADHSRSNVMRHNADVTGLAPEGDKS